MDHTDAKNFEIGSIVWAKFSSYPHWPAQIVDEYDIVQYEKLPIKNKPYSRLVRFFGSNDLSFIPPNKIVDYSENKKRFTRKSQSKKLSKAIEECEIALGNKTDNCTVEKEKAGQKVKKSRKSQNVGNKNTLNISNGTPRRKKQKLNSPKKFVLETGNKRIQNKSLEEEKSKKIEVQPTTKKIGLLAYGSYSLLIARRLVHSGHDVTLWFMDTQTESVAFATIVSSAAEVVNKSELIFVCLENFENSEKVLKNLVTDNTYTSKGFIEMSTMHSEKSKHLDKLVKKHDNNLYLEAPFFGSLGDASEGSLIIKTSGDRSLHNDCKSCFSAIASKIEYLGSLSTAMTQMTMLNGMGASLYISTLEAYSTAEKAGMDLDILTDVIRNCKLSSSFMKNRLNDIMNDEYRTQYPLHLQEYYAAEMIDLAKVNVVNLPITSAVHESLNPCGRNSEKLLNGSASKQA